MDGADGMMRLAQILNATLELDATVRKNAEQELLRLETQRGFALIYFMYSLLVFL